MLQVERLITLIITVIGITCPISVNAKILSKIDLNDPLPAGRFIELAKLVNPTVVNISTIQKPKVRRNHPRNPYGRDPFFDLFEQFMGPQQRQPRQGLGTGFIIRKDGLILTNNHVVEGADIIRVQLSEDSKDIFEAQLIGSDKRTDTALIKIDAKRTLPAAKLGNSKDLQVGEWVAAFGNPFGHGHTMTKGIISAIGRKINELNRFPFLQTDASINPGNSGGPLVNIRGEVIGVNTAIDARAQGIGFAIPIDDVKSILESLEKNGGIERGFLGVSLRDIGPRGAKILGLKSTDGSLVEQVVKGSPAAKGGLKPYDFITEINDSEIGSSEELIRKVADLTVGQNVKIKLLRDGKKKTVTVKIGSHPDNRKKKAAATKTYRGQKAPYGLGFTFTTYNQRIAKEFELPKLNNKKPVVIKIDWNSPAARSGLMAGDIILDVNRKSVHSIKDIFKRLKKGQVNILRVLRQDTALLVFIEPK